MKNQHGESGATIAPSKISYLSCLSFSFLAIEAAFCFSRYSAYQVSVLTIETDRKTITVTCSACMEAALLFAASPPPPPSRVKNCEI